MTYQGKVANGVVVLDNGASLPDGTVVRVEEVSAAGADQDATSLASELLKLAGTCKGLPSDLSENHDHYLYGMPKR